MYINLIFYLISYYFLLIKKRGGLSLEQLSMLLSKYKYISCVLFYGGEWDLSYLSFLCDFIKKNYNLKIALYTGREFDFFNLTFLSKLDFIKVNPFIKDLGGLSSPLTNQKFFILENGIIKQELFFY